MSSWLIDPRSGDYVMDKGKPVPTEELTVPAFYRIRIPRGKWLYAPNDKYGSDLNSLKKNPGQATLNMMETAVQPMIDDGRASSVEVTFDTVQPSSRNDQAVTVVITDAEGTQQPLNLPPVGD